MKKHALLIAIGLVFVLLFVGHAAKVYQLDFVNLMEAKLYDTRLQLTLPDTPDESIIILDIDEKSLKEDGRWPWGRDKLALLMDKLFDKYEIAVVGFDVVFAEKDISSGLGVLQELGKKQLKNIPQFQSELAKIKPQLEYDSLFAKRLQQRNTVLGYYFTGTKNISGALPEPVFEPNSFDGRPITFTKWKGYGGNLPELQASAASAGHFNPIVDSDGVVRRVPLIVEYEGAYYESLSMAVVRSIFGSPPLIAGFANESDNADYAGLEWIGLDQIQIPVDSDVSALVPYRGGRNTFKYVSMSDVLHERTPVEELQGKIILVGTSAPGLMDMRATPVGEVYPGVEIHANMISGILNQSIKSSPPFVMGVEVVILLVVGLALSFLLPLVSPVKTTLVTLGVVLATVVINGAVWQYGNIALPVAGGLMMIFALFALNMSYGYFVESRTKRQITNLFGQYVPKEVVGELSERPEQVSMEGDSREMTILFSDVRGFTTISEGLDSKELSLLMNEFLTPLSRVVYKHRGTIDKYMGDCIMAFWGAPLPDERHAYHGIMAGLEMLKTLAELQPHFKERGWPPINIGVGLNTGRVSVGNMGSEVRVAYTVMGDAVNLASRLEGITKEYGAGIVVGENTMQAAPEFVYRELDLVRVKGKDKPVAIFEPMGLVGQLASGVQEEMKLFEQVLQLYRRQDWDAAEAQLLELQKMSPQAKLYHVYAERISYFRENPLGSDWDGVFVFKTK
ncbi:MAG: adenylate/guanylate cyclase domain-containing protein [Gallionellaceae bacterium]|jgi:adenylate cyclase